LPRHGLDHGEFLYRLFHLAAPSHTGGVNDGVFLSAALEVNVNGIARGAWLVECDHTLLTEDGVHQGGFADIRAADDGQFRRMFVTGFLFLFPFCLKREILQRELDHLAHVVAMRRGNRQRLAQTQLEKIGSHLGALHSLRLVDQQQNRLAGLAQLTGDECVLRRATGAAVNQEQHHVSFIHRLAALPGHLEQDAVLGDRFQPAGIHHQIRSFPYPTLPIMAVARQPRLVGDQRVAAAREAVEQGGLAHVRTAN